MHKSVMQAVQRGVDLVVVGLEQDTVDLKRGTQRRPHENAS
jgi:hypothetical protein